MKRHPTGFTRILLLTAFVSALAFVLWSCAQDAGTPVGPVADQNEGVLLAADLEPALAAHNRAIPRILATPGVVGTAIGADERGKPVIMIYTEEEIPAGKLQSTYEGLSVITQVTGPIEPVKTTTGDTSGRVKQTPPVKMGTSGGWRYDLANGYCCGGTLGALVQKGGTKYVLSNWHVLYADIVSGGNARTVQPGDPVIQPGLIDVNCSATSAQNIATIVSNGGTLPDAGNPDAVDAGIASVIPGMVDETGAILNIGTISSQTLAATVGLAVKKMGRTTGLTRSSITGINGAFTITYSNECAGGTAFSQSYTGQIVIANSRCKFQTGGDSGSLLVQDVSVNPKAVGLCFAGSSTCTNSSIAIANPIDKVLAKLGATMVGQ
jgi:hypothetical protein